jgi:hypothetical protein
MIRVTLTQLIRQNEVGRLKVLLRVMHALIMLADTGVGSGSTSAEHHGQDRLAIA